MIAIVAGGTGLVGSLLIEKLIADPEVEKVISVSRRPLSHVNQKLSEVIVSDLAELGQANEELKTQLKGDSYFCCLGTTIKAAGSKEKFKAVDHDAIVNFAKIAADHSAHSFQLVSSMGASSNSSFFYNQVKGQTEEALQKLKLRSLTIFRPGLLIGDRKEFRLAEKLFISVFQPLSKVLPASLSKRVATDVSVLAEHMLQSAKAAKPVLHRVEAGLI